MLMYKIRNKKTGQFSMGSDCPYFNSLGKVWKRKQDLASHFRMVGDYDRDIMSVYKDCEIVVLEVVEKETLEIGDL